MDLTKNTQRLLTEIKEDALMLNRSNVTEENYLLMKQNFPNSVGYMPNFAFNNNIL